MNRFTQRSAGGALIALLSSPVLGQSDTSIVISNVTVIDVETGVKRPGQFVRVAGSRIASIGSIFWSSEGESPERDAALCATVRLTSLEPKI